jgi:hypothetical protein
MRMRLRMNVDRRQETTRRRRGLRGALAVLTLAGGAALAPAGAAQEPRTVPVYDLETPGHVLEARVFQEDFPVTASFAWAALDEVAASAEQPEAVRLAARYLRRVTQGRFDELPELFWMETTSPRAISAVAKILRAVLDRLGEPDRLTFLHTWRYGDFRMVVVEVAGASGESRVIALGMAEREGRLLRSDDWGRALPAMDLFSYMARNLNRGLVAGREPAGLPLALTLPAERFGVVVRFAGAVHAADAAEAADLHPAVAFARRVFEAAAAGPDAAFVELWNAEQREELTETLATAPGRASGLRERFAASGGVRHLLTADLGDHLVHYYRRAGAPRVRYLILQRVDGELRLSDDLYTNIENLMVSDLTLEQVPSLAGEGGSE